MAAPTLAAVGRGPGAAFIVLAPGQLPDVEANVPDGADLGELRRAAATCTGCDLYRDATQTVFGEGPDSAKLVIVGEQPGDREDREGRPFVGPAGRLLDELLDDAGIDREVAYLTNAVKHFKWIAKGKRRIHQRPDAAEIAACRPWLEAELDRLGPEVLLCRCDGGEGGHRPLVPGDARPRQLPRRQRDAARRLRRRRHGDAASVSAAANPRGGRTAGGSGRRRRRSRRRGRPARPGVIAGFEPSLRGSNTV